MASTPLYRGTERRRGPRFIYGSPISVSLTVHGAPLVLYGLCGDISEGGLCAYLMESLATDQAVELDVTLPNGPLKVKAQLRHCVDHHCGFQFMGLTEEQRLQLREAIKKMEPVLRAAWSASAAPRL